ncbi:MAG: ATP-binding protein [Kofleriaceae bacterium]
MDLGLLIQRALMYQHTSEHIIDQLVRIQLLLDRATGNDADIDHVIAAHDAAIGEREAASVIALPLAVLAERFELAPIDVELLVAAALPGLDVGLAQRWQHHCRSGAPERRVFELVDLLAHGNAGNYLARLAADQPLQRGGLVRLVSSSDWAREAPLLQRVVTVPDAVVDAIVGRFVFDARLAAVAQHHATAVGVTTPELATLISLIAEGVAPVVVAGGALVGKSTAIAMAATALGRGTIVARLDLIAASGDALRWLDEVHCAARLLDAVLVLRTGDGFDALPLPLQRAVGELARGGAIITAHAPAIARRFAGPRLVEIAAPDAATQTQVWHAQLGPVESNLDIEAVVARCPLPIGEIVEAAAAARSAGHAITVEALVAAARARLQHRLSDVASIVTTTLEWTDLVVREEVSQRIAEILGAVANRTHVLETWGFADKLPYGRSVSALLAGPPGTGKTMVATLIAKQLGLELFRIDLSKVVSKWIGETEKNLGKVFDEAGRVGAVLLFDEADALFAKRTDVKSSNDRNANLEVNYLLQRLENHDGIVLLTTNSATSIDEAFKRRLRFRIEFPAPDPAEREALWRAMFPARAPIDRGVDFRALATRFNMAGGHIKNAAVRAAFLAAERSAPTIDHATLLHAATLEWTELGNLPT